VKQIIVQSRYMALKRFTSLSIVRGFSLSNSSMNKMTGLEKSV
jgi:hypothetical protein